MVNHVRTRQAARLDRRIGSSKKDLMALPIEVRRPKVAEAIAKEMRDG